MTSVVDMLLYFIVFIDTWHALALTSVILNNLLYLVNVNLRGGNPLKVISVCNYRLT